MKKRFRTVLMMAIVIILAMPCAAQSDGGGKKKKKVVKTEQTTSDKTKRKQGAARRQQEVEAKRQREDVQRRQEEEPKRQQEEARREQQKAGLQSEIINNLINNMVYVEGGSFTMGSDDSDADSYEKPAHRETVGSFSIGKYEVTQREWKEVMGNNPSHFKGDDLPVENVS